MAWVRFPAPPKKWKKEERTRKEKERKRRRRKNIIYIGFHTLLGFRHSLEVLEHIPHGQEGPTAF